MSVLSKSMNDKHTFLKHAKPLKGVSMKHDNDLTMLQQKNRQHLSADFDALKSKRHKPVYQGSSLSAMLTGYAPVKVMLQPELQML